MQYFEILHQILCDLSEFCTKVSAILLCRRFVAEGEQAEYAHAVPYPKKLSDIVFGGSGNGAVL